MLNTVQKTNAERFGLRKESTKREARNCAGLNEESAKGF
jgi:hypothetical protein